MMLTANLVGFVTGVEGMKYMGEQVFGTFEGMLAWTKIFHQCMY